MEGTEKDWKPGLEGVVAAETTLCDIDGKRGELVYCGYNITDLAKHSTFEEVVFLLWEGRLPNRAEWEQMRQDLEENSRLSRPLLELLEKRAAKTRPMEMMRSFVSLMADDDPELEDHSPAANRRKALRITASLPTLIAAYDRLRHGLPLVPPAKGQNFATRFFYQLKAQVPSATVARALDVALVLHAEHGFNASTFAARVTAATLSDMYSAITSALGALKGPLHGGANEVVIKMLLEIGTPDKARDWIAARIQEKKRIFGFGHRVYKTLDPRAPHLAYWSEQVGKEMGQPKWFEISKAIHQAVIELKSLEANVDFYSASLYYGMGLSTDLFTPIFAISRAAGWTAHVIEQHKNNRLIRPLSEYVGPWALKYVPIEKRG